MEHQESTVGGGGSVIAGWVLGGSWKAGKEGVEGCRRNVCMHVCVCLYGDKEDQAKRLGHDG
jgi:hypothetical protein